MAYTYTTKVGDTARQVQHTLMLYGRVLDLTGATVHFIARHTADTTVYIDGVASIIDPLHGKVRYKFTSAQTDKSGMYLCEWRITFPDGSILTVPDNDNLTLEIVKGVKKQGNV